MHPQNTHRVLIQICLDKDSQLTLPPPPRQVVFYPYTWTVMRIFFPVNKILTTMTIHLILDRSLNKQR